MEIPSDVFRRLRGNFKLDPAWIDSIPALLTQALEQNNVDSKSVVFFPHGRGGVTFKCIWQDRDVIIKIYADPGLVDHEIAWHRFWGRLQVWQTDNPHVVIMEFLDDHTNFKDYEIDIEKKIDRVMLETRHGYLHRSVPQELAFYADHHRSFIPQHIDQVMKKRAKRYSGAIDYGKWIDAVKSPRANVLLHGDMSPANILYNPDSDHMFFIDPNMMEGDSSYDWAKLIIHLQRFYGMWGTDIFKRIDQVAQICDRELALAWVEFFAYDRYLYYLMKDKPDMQRLAGWKHIISALHT